MYNFPENFEWLPPWFPIKNEQSHLNWAPIWTISDQNQVGKSLVQELQREVPKGHLLYGLSLKAVAFCSADPNEFLFVTDDPEKPIAFVHLTWEEEKKPNWPYTRIYTSSEDWYVEMNREHD